MRQQGPRLVPMLAAAAAARIAAAVRTAADLLVLLLRLLLQWRGQKAEAQEPRSSDIQTQGLLLLKPRRRWAAGVPVCVHGHDHSARSRNGSCALPLKK